MALLVQILLLVVLSLGAKANRDIDDKPKDIVCDPPICPVGCFIEEEYDGPCPECKCKDQDIDDNPKDIVCDPPICPVGCFIEEEYDGPCPECKCKDQGTMDLRRQMCSPPKCPPGCFVQKEFDSLCPECECPEEEKKDVPLCPTPAVFRITMVCDSNCVKVKDENGCETCTCHPKCPHPHCPRWCTVKEGEHGCLKCECPQRKTFWKRYDR